MRLQGFFLSELSAFARRELGDVAVEHALAQASPGLSLPIDPTRPCAPAAFRALARALARAGGVPTDEWLRRFGAALFGRLAALHGVFFVGFDSAFDFLAGIESGVHDELRRLGAGIDPPRLSAELLEPTRLRVTYRSERALAALAHGMLEGCLAHFGEAGVVHAHAGSDGSVSFLIERAADPPPPAAAQGSAPAG